MEKPIPTTTSSPSSESRFKDIHTVFDGSDFGERGRQSANDDFDPSNCKLSPDAGPCQKRLQRYFHSGGQCMTFSYGGCAGNLNNFFSLKECESKCLMRPLVENVDLSGLGGQGDHLDEPCQLPPDPGQCQERLRRFYFNTSTNKCEEFLFGGCGGNANNFAKLSKCVNRCGVQN